MCIKLFIDISSKGIYLMHPMCFKIYAYIMVHLNYTIYEVVAKVLNSSLVFNPHSLEEKLRFVVFSVTTPL